ncbi:MAG TPA: PIG-L family deacetylase, partial [Acidobacteriota bacterium]|nr:PIG-L family deacetylase [Acidobacteriota bacterium]
MRRTQLHLFSLFLFVSASFADVRPKSVDAAALKLQLKKLTVLGNVLYIAAHPDDENTAVLAYLSKGRLLRTGYLSLTRGDGGQNLLGPEQGRLLGVIRTQELLRAREIDGAEQFFTRAVDFGYSKTAEETLRLWGKEEILSDVVWVIRRFQPDVIITRFTPQGGGHGNHTASAILAAEAFDAAADPSRFPEQLRWVKPWRARRLVWNMYSWGRLSEDDRKGALAIDVGEYSPVLGKSFREIAGQSRSMHKSQGMGAPEARGSSTNYFKVLAGEPAATDLMEGIDLSWNRVPGGAAVGEVLQKACQSFDFEKPSQVVGLLVQAYQMIQKLEPSPLVRYKSEETLETIRLCSGLWLEAVADRASASPGQQIEVKTSAIKRSHLPVKLLSIALEPGGESREADIPLEYNIPAAVTVPLVIPRDASYTQPYWLTEEGTPYRHRVEDQRNVGLAEGTPPFHATMRLAVADAKLVFEVPVIYQWVDPIEGERHRIFEVAPEVSVQLHQPVTLWSDGQPRKVKVTVTNGSGSAAGTVSLDLPEGWSSSPGSFPFAMSTVAESKDFEFEVSPSAVGVSGPVTAVADLGAKVIRSSVVKIRYPHIPPQTVLEESRAVLLRVDVATIGRRVGYIMGSGDSVPEALRQLGYEVILLSDEDLSVRDLSGYDAIVVGIRAYNTRPILRSAHSRLLGYVAAGGTLVVQYNTLQDLIRTDLGPYPF